MRFPLVKRDLLDAKKMEMRGVSTQWMLDACHKNELTPDVWSLSNKEFQVIFVCDDMMRKHNFHDVLDPCVYAFDAFTHDKFCMWKRNAGQLSYPVTLDPEGKEILCPPLRVKGEVYIVPQPSRVLSLVDVHMQNTVYYQRRKVNLTVPNRKIMRRVNGEASVRKCYDDIQAWMYVGVSDYWIGNTEEPIDGGYNFSPVQKYVTYNDWMPEDPYYFFSHKELID